MTTIQKKDLRDYRPKAIGCLIILTIAGEPLSIEELGWIKSQLPNRLRQDDSYEAIKMDLDGFRQKGWVKKVHGKEYKVIDEEIVPLLRLFYRQPYFREYVSTVVYRLRRVYWDNYSQNSSLRLLRDMRLALLKGELDQYRYLRNISASYSDERLRRDHLREMFLEPEFQEQLVRDLPKEIQGLLVRNFLNEAEMEMLEAPDLYEFAEDIATQPEASSNPYLVDCMVGIIARFLEKGDEAGFQRLSHHIPKKLEVSFQLHYWLLQQNWNTLYKTFFDPQLRPQGHFTVKGYPSEAIAFLLKSFGFSISQEGLWASLQMALRNENQYESAYLDWLEAIGEYYRGNFGMAEGVLAELPDCDRPLTYLFIAYTQATYFPENLSTRQLQLYFEMAYSNRLHWLALHFAGILAFACGKEAYLAPYEQLSDQLGQEHWLDQFQPFNRWELALSALESMQEVQGEPDRSQTPLRVIWLINLEEEFFQPKLQKIKKSGGWSKGRNIRLERLLEEEQEGMTRQDFEIAETLSNYLEHPYLIPVEEVFQALCDHPYLFFEESRVPVEISKGNPELQVQARSGHFHLTLSLPLHHSREAGLNLIKETPTRYKLVEVNPELLDLSYIIGDELVIPQSQEDRLAALLMKLKEKVPVQSTLTEEVSQIPLVENDPRIFVHLLPVGDGFHVELFVRPIPEVAQYFAPGKGAAMVFGEKENERIRTERNLAEEEIRSAEVVERIPVLQQTAPENGVWQLKDAETCLHLLAGLEQLRKEGLVAVEWPKGEKLRINHLASIDQLHLSIRSRSNWLELTGELQLSDQMVMNMEHLIEQVRKKDSPFIEISDGQFIALTERFREQLKTLEHLSQGKGKKLRLHPLSSGFLDEWAEEMADFQADKAWREKLERLRSANRKRFRTPRDFEGTLRDYQKEGFRWLCRLAWWGVGACLADDMGLGKTIQALALLLHRKSEGPGLVVAPASVCRNWKKEAERFTPDLIAYFYNEEGRKERLNKLESNHLLIITYGLMQQDIEALEKIHFGTIILDEAQAIKNRTAKRTKAAMRLEGNFRMVTTGTPIENHLSELWSIFQFINPGLLGSHQHFTDKFILPIERDKDQEVRNSLRKLIQPFILRRRKEQVLQELPPKTEIQLDVELSPDQLAFYEALRRDSLKKLEMSKKDPSGSQHLRILAEISRLRQACCHPALVSPRGKKLGSAKMKVLSDTLEELLESDHKVLIFSQFVRYLKLIEQWMQEEEIAYQYLDGSTPIAKRQERIDAFQSGEGDVFLISLKAGGTGLNLTAADYVIHMDPWWNPAVEDQASDRAHRIGQTRPVTVYRLVTQHTIEEKIMQLHDEKRQLADSLLEGTDSSGKLSADQLLELMKP